MVDVLRGREGELAAAARLLRRAGVGGQGAVICLRGEAGIGKTALVQAIAGQAADAGFAVGVGKAEELHQIAAGAPLLVALRTGSNPLLDADSFAGLAPLHHQPLWLVDRVASLLADVAARTPVLIVIDDAQWADPVTRFALDTLPSRLAGSPVVWLVVSRDVADTTADAPDGVERHRLVLGPLSEVALDLLACDYLGGPAEGVTRRRLHAVGGNPFLAVQLLVGAAAARSAGLAADDIPASFAAAIDARLRSLGARTGELVELAAVWGRPLDLSDAAELLGEPVMMIAALRREAHARGLLADDRDHIVFAHDLIREAAYQNVPAAARRELHLRCAKYLVASGKGVVAAAPHARAGARFGDLEAVEILRGAAAQTSLTMPAVAAPLIVEAFGLLGPHDTQRMAIGEQCAEILIRAQRGNDAVTVIDTLLAATSDSDARAHLQSLAAQALWLTGQLGEIDRRLVDARTRPALSPRLQARLAAVEALVLTKAGTAQEAGAVAEAALSRGRALGDECTQLLALQALAEAGTAEGRHASARGHYRALRALGGTTYLAGEILALQQLDRFAEAGELLARADHGEKGRPGEHGLPSLVFAQLLQDFKLGRLAEAEAGALTVIRLCDEIGTYVHKFEAWLIAGVVAVIRGDLALARERLKSAEETGLTDDAVRQPPMLLIKGRIAGAEGRFEDSVRIFKPLMASLAQSRSWWPRNPELLRVQAGIAVAAGDDEFARETVERAKLAAERNPGVASFEGVALQVEGFVSRDPATLRSAVKILRESPRPLLLAGALADYGAVLVDKGDRHTAVAVLSEAHDGFAGLGANHYLRRVERDLNRAGAPADQREALTKAEERVAQLVSEGHTNQSVASALGVSVHTVNTHLRAVFRKMGVRSRVQLANAMSAKIARGH